MALETASFIDGLNTSNPVATDGLAQADDHIRLIKSAVKSTFPNVAGAMTADHTELSTLDGYTGTTADFNLLSGQAAAGVTSTHVGHLHGVSSNIQTQLNTLTTNLATTNANLSSAVPTGMIMMWSGASNAIPSGYVLCDGNNSTPDLRDRFVVGAGNSYSVGSTGGASSVTLTVSQMPAHTHTTNISFSPDVDYFGNNVSILNNGQNGTNSVGGQSTDFTSSSSGGGGSHENRPPYYALCYVMKT